MSSRQGAIVNEMACMSTPSEGKGGPNSPPKPKSTKTGAKLQRGCQTPSASHTHDYPIELNGVLDVCELESN